MFTPKWSRTEMVLNRNYVMDLFSYIVEKRKLFSILLSSSNH